MGGETQRWSFRGDAALAVGIAVLLGVIWAWRDWANLSALHLPDTDDAVRLQQIRDWLAGQAFGDLSQHRLAGGLVMHWSRLPDLVPGGIIAGMTPLVGRHSAELSAVLAWPALLFAIALFLVARITRAVAPAAAPTAIVVAAIGYPVTSLFLPGRIDHHGLQIVLLLAVVHVLVAVRTARGGAIAGALVATSIAIGMEMAPFLLLAGLWFWADWLRCARGADATMRSLGASLVAAALLARLVVAGNGFEFDGCDGFTRPVWLILLAGGGGALVLGVSARSLAYRPGRLAISAGVGVVMLMLVWPVARGCLHPYGAVDPIVAARWLDHVGEAQSLLAVPLPTAIGYAGLLVAGIAAGLWQAIATRARGWAMLSSFQIAALALSLVELRGVYAGAILAAPALAAAIGAARARGSLPLAAAWLGSAGMLYPLAAQALTPAIKSKAGVGAGCSDRHTLARLRGLPVGTLLAPIDLGAYALAETRHRVIAAPYHRNNAGNAALYRFFEGSPAEAEAIARGWRVDYVVACDPMPAGALADRLRDGAAPAWLEPIGPGMWQTR